MVSKKKNLFFLVEFCISNCSFWVELFPSYLNRSPHMEIGPSLVSGEHNIRRHAHHKYVQLKVHERRHGHNFEERY